MDGVTFRTKYDIRAHTIEFTEHYVALYKFGVNPIPENWNRSEADVAIRYFLDLELNPSDFNDNDVIDIGCGPGFFKKTILRIGSPKTYINLDINPFLENLDIIADAARMPFKDNSFDLVLSFGSIAGVRWNDFQTRSYLCVNPLDSLWEVARILRSGGVAKIGPISLLRSCWKNENDGVKYESVRHEFFNFATLLKEKFPCLEIEFYRIIDSGTGRFDEWMTFRKQ
ncbi:MAG: methyltransferase domain-containing protein [Candidatus Niyogibacteria bacterium]|nr:MAG: methyltransferase domain-containing protein [Candidatus Niyogibacteria bacterium]